jgi:hypothetical protein
MTVQKSQGHVAAAGFHLKKKIIIIHLSWVSMTAILVPLAFIATCQVRLGRIPFKIISRVIPGSLGLFHHIDSPCDQQYDQREQTHLIIDAVIPVKVSGPPGKNVDMNVLKTCKKEKIKCDYLLIHF